MKRLFYYLFVPCMFLFLACEDGLVEVITIGNPGNIICIYKDTGLYSDSLEVGSNVILSVDLVEGANSYLWTISGPADWKLAYKLPGGEFIEINDSEGIAVGSSVNTYNALSPSYTYFELPSELYNQPEVTVRVYMTSMRV